MDWLYIHDGNREYIIDLNSVLFVKRLNTDDLPGLSIEFGGSMPLYISDKEEVARVWGIFKRSADRLERQKVIS